MDVVSGSGKVLSGLKLYLCQRDMLLMMVMMVCPPSIKPCAKPTTELCEVPQ